MKLTFYGHCTFGVQVGDTHLLFDPFFSGNPVNGHINVAEVPADYILLSHAHEHCVDALAIAQRTQAKIISNWEIVTHFSNKHAYDNGHPMNHGGAARFDFGKVKYVSAVHSSSFGDGSYAGHPGGFVVETAERNFYYSGDTALTMDMKLIPRFTKLDFAVLCIGDNFTMGIDEAVVCAEFIDCDTIIGVHFDTFPYIEIDHEAAKAAFKAKGKELILLEVGGIKEL